VYAIARMHSGTILVSAGRTLRQLAAGQSTVLAEADGDIGPLAPAPDGTVYYTTGTQLFRLPPGGQPEPVGGAVLSNPHGLAVAPDGTVLVSDTGHGQVERFDPSTGRASTFARLPEPRGLAVTAAGTVLAVEARSHRVLRLDATGRRLGVVGPRFGDPYALSAGRGGVTYVIDTAAVGRIYRVDARGRATVLAR
jgi:streptogramin lyase